VPERLLAQCMESQKAQAVIKVRAKRNYKLNKRNLLMSFNSKYKNEDIGHLILIYSILCATF
jgi:hypothetical protein